MLSSVEVVETVRANGGGTLHAITGQTPSRGYMVGVGSDRAEIVPGEILDSLNATGHTIKAFTKQHADLLGLPDYYLGLWLNAGKLYLDVSQNILDATLAILAGIRRDQIAIWDVVNGCEIATGGTGEV
jgi:hypothetical protein